VSGDDIVQRLRRWDDGRVSTHYDGCWDSHPVCAILLAADAIEARDAEIERLRAEVERLTAERDAERALADQLFEAMGAVQWAIPSSDQSLIIWKAAVAAHQEARRER